MRKPPRTLIEEQAKAAEEEQAGINAGLVRFRRDAPEIASRFMEFWRLACHREGVIPRKYRELMSLCVVLVEHCKPCIFLHTRLCLEAGATREEILETAGIALAMGGGIVYEYIGYLMEALETIQSKQEGGKENG